MWIHNLWLLLVSTCIIGIYDEIKVARISIDNLKKQTDEHIAILIKADRVNIFARKTENLLERMILIQSQDVLLFKPIKYCLF